MSMCNTGAFMETHHMLRLTNDDDTANMKKEH